MKRTLGLCLLICSALLGPGTFVSSLCCSDITKTPRVVDAAIIEEESVIMGCAALERLQLLKIQCFG